MEHQLMVVEMGIVLVLPFVLTPSHVGFVTK
jgi:hypothetical protein